MDLHPTKRIPEDQAAAEEAVRVAFARYLEWQTDGGWETFVSFVKDEGPPIAEPTPTNLHLGCGGVIEPHHVPGDYTDTWERCTACGLQGHPLGRVPA